MNAYFITWTTYGTWLPGDARGWRKRMTKHLQPEPTALAAGPKPRPEPTALAAGPTSPKTVNGPEASAFGSGGPREPRPNLERWCREQMNGEPVLLRPHDRLTIEKAIADHCTHRGWALRAASARTNHVHVVVFASAAPKVVRDQLKANCTGALRRQTDPLVAEKTWATGGDTEVLETDEEIYNACLYVTEGQDKPNPN